MTVRIGYLVSHPIQYYAPLFRELARHCDLTVFYAHRQTAAGQADAGFGRECAQPGFGAIEQYAAAVTRDAVRIHAAAMGHARERGERLIDQPAARRRADLCDQSEPAAVVFERVVVQARRDASRHAAFLARAQRSIQCDRLRQGLAVRGPSRPRQKTTRYDLESNIDVAMRQITKLSTRPPRNRRTDPSFPSKCALTRWRGTNRRTPAYCQADKHARRSPPLRVPVRCCLSQRRTSRCHRVRGRVGPRHGRGSG